MYSLYSNTTGYSNIASGFRSLYSNTTGSRNTASGQDSLFDNTTGSWNTASGYRSLNDLTSGSHNTALGYQAGSNITTGSSNIIIGPYAHSDSASSANCIALGYNVGGSNSTFTFGSNASDTRCTHGSTTWSTPSDERYKKDITDATAGLSFINDLRPVTYNWKNEGDLPTTHTSYVEGSTTPYNSAETQHGFIAQEVKAAIDAHPEIKDGFDMWAEDVDGRQRLGETALIPMLVKSIKELSAENKALLARIEALETPTA